MAQPGQMSSKKKNSKTAKTNTPLGLPPLPSPRLDPTLIGRLQVLLAELGLEPSLLVVESAPLPQDSTVTILAAIE